MAALAHAQLGDDGRGPSAGGAGAGQPSRSVAPPRVNLPCCASRCCAATSTRWSGCWPAPLAGQVRRLLPAPPGFTPWQPWVTAKPSNARRRRCSRPVATVRSSRTRRARGRPRRPRVTRAGRGELRRARPHILRGRDAREHLSIDHFDLGPSAPVAPSPVPTWIGSGKSSRAIGASTPGSRTANDHASFIEGSTPAAPTRVAAKAPPRRRATPEWPPCPTLTATMGGLTLSWRVTGERRGRRCPGPRLTSPLPTRA